MTAKLAELSSLDGYLLSGPSAFGHDLAMGPTRNPGRTTIAATVVEVLIDTGDARALPACWNEEGPTPVRRYGLSRLSPFPPRRGAIYIRHGLVPLVVDISDAGGGCLDGDLAADSFARAAGLSRGEFLGLQLGRWLAPRSLQQEIVLFREMQYLRYRIERARIAKKRELVVALQALLAEWRERRRPYIEVAFRDVLGKSIH